MGITVRMQIIEIISNIFQFICCSAGDNHDDVDGGGATAGASSNICQKICQFICCSGGVIHADNGGGGAAAGASSKC